VLVAGLVGCTLHRSCLATSVGVRAALRCQTSRAKAPAIAVVDVPHAGLAEAPALAPLASRVDEASASSLGEVNPSWRTNSHPRMPVG